MLRHHLAASLRAFARTPLTTAASILTLALGLACFVAAYGVSRYWQSGDRHHPGAERLVYVCTYCERGQPGEVQSPERLAAALQQELPELEATARLGFPVQLAVSSGSEKAFLQGTAADPGIFDVFAFRFLEGGPQQALRRPGDVVLTADAAHRLFGDTAALGRTLRVDGAWDATVSAVVEPMQRPSFLAEDPMRIEVLTNLAAARDRMRVRLGMPEGAEDAWTNGAVQTFVRYPASLTLPSLQARLDAFAARVIPLDDRGDLETTLTAHPVSRIQSSIVTARLFLGEDIGITAGGLLMSLGGLILLVAGVNYSNLATAQALARAKEAGLRKVLGARRGQVLAQHFVEAGLMVLAAVVLAVILIAMAAPVFRHALGADPLHFMADAGGLLSLLAVVLATTVAVGAWPAVTLARVRPRDALGLSLAGSRPGGWPSRVLVGAQFFMASFLLITVVMLELQHRHLRHAAFSAEHDPVLILNDLNQTGIAPGTLATQLRKVVHVREVAMTQFAPWSGSSHTRVVGRSGEPGSNGSRIQVKAVDERYFEAFGLTQLAGRAFDSTGDNPDAEPFAADSAQPAPVVIDRRLAKALGFGEPRIAIGQSLYQTPRPGSPPSRPVATIVGVVDTEFATINGNTNGVMFVFDGDFTRATIPVVRISSEHVAGAMAGIRASWDEIAPHIPLRARFSDELFEARLQPFRTLRTTFLVLSLVAFLIAIAGVLAVAIHVAARRRHEIGVRKALGATSWQVMRMLMLQLSIPVLIGNVLAWPAAWALAQVYLRLFVERVSVGPMVFLSAIVFTLLLAWVAVVAYAWRAASAEPALVLQRGA